MRKITKEIVALLAVFVIYFGYSAWFDGAASNIMDKTSLLYSILAPFKLVLVGGVFGLLIPLTKSIFFGTIIGIKNYVKARRGNVLFNYQGAIAFVSDLKATLETGDYEQIKAKYAAYSGLAFKPQFLNTMMEEIGDSLIRQQDMSIYIKPADVVLRSIKQMYEKERKLAISQKPTEMFFDFKRGYEYTSMGSKYSIAYFKALDTKADTKAKLGWKVFSLEMFKFIVAMLGAIVPTIIVAVIVLPIVGKAAGSAAGIAAPAVIFGLLMVFSIAIHAIMTFTKSQYRVMWKSLIVPAVCYYGALILLAATFVLGLNTLISGLGNGAKGVINILDPLTNKVTETKNGGPMTGAGTAVANMWLFFSLLSSLVLTTCLMMYVISTLMDAFSSPNGLTVKVLVDGVVIPLVAWTAAMVLSLMAGFGSDTFNKSTVTSLSSASFGISVGFWIYLSISSVLINNIVFPSRKQKMALQAELADEGLQGLEKQQKADKARKTK